MRKELISKRKKILNNIIGTWESEFFKDEENNKIKLVLSFDYDFLLGDEPNVLKARKKYLNGNDIEYPITLWWDDVYFITTSLCLKQGLFRFNDSTKVIEVFKHNFELTKENLITEFKKYKI